MANHIEGKQDSTDRDVDIPRHVEAELDLVRADHTGSQQFAVPRIRTLIQRIQEIDRELEQIELAIEIERQLDA